MTVSKETMRLLLLYAIKAAGSVIPVSRLLDAAALTDLKFMELTACFNSMVEDGTILVENFEDEQYATIDKKISDAVEEIKNQIPLSLRKTVASAVAAEMASAKRDLEVKTEIIKEKDGYSLRLRLTESDGDAFDMKLFLPTLLQAELTAAKFKADPYGIYGAILNLLSGDS